MRVNFKESKKLKRKTIHFITQSKETAEFSKIVSLLFDQDFRHKYSVTHQTSLYEFNDRFGFIRKYFHSLQEDDNDLNARLQSNEYLRALDLPVIEKDFGLELREDLFKQLYWAEKNQNKRTNLNYRLVFITNQLRDSREFISDFSFNLAFLQKIVYSTNEENLGKLIVNLLNALFIWLDLGVLDLHLFFVFCHDYLLVFLCLSLPGFICKHLKKLKSSLGEPLKPRPLIVNTRSVK